MTRDAQASLRMPTALKQEIERIASETRRSLSSSIELLLWRGVEEFKKDGVLIGRPESPLTQTSSRADPDSERWMDEMAELVLETALKKARERKLIGGGEKPRKKRKFA